MKIRFTDHALTKIEILKEHDVEISAQIVEDAIRHSDIIEKGYRDRLIAQKRLTDDHVLRVVYEKSDEEIIVITVYPGRRSRYEKD